MKLKELLQGLEIIKMTADPELEINSVTYDSRRAVPGCLFVAITGFVTDGNLYITMAMEKGAVAVVTAVELGTGFLFNRDYRVWDYRDLPLNYRGQICLPFSVLWMPVSLAAVTVYDALDS